MPTTDENVRKVIDLTVKTEHLTEDVLKNCMQEFLSHTSEKKGKMSVGELARKSNGGKLESIKVSDKNIRSFLETAKKYDVDYALKRDSSTQPTTYHVFFSSSKTENIKRAFTEYAEKKQSALSQDRGEVSRDVLKKEARRIAKQPRKEKVHEKHREQSK